MRTGLATDQTISAIKYLTREIATGSDHDSARPGSTQVSGD
jgi:hypothetical protein